MSLSPVAFIAPNYKDYSGRWIKFYQTGTSTPKTIYLDSASVTSAAKVQINVDGFIVSSASAIVVPYISGSYDAYIFVTEALADANDTTGAERIADNIAGADSGLQNFDNIAEMEQAFLDVSDTALCKRYYAGGDLVYGLLFDIVAATGTNDGCFFHNLDNGNQAKLIHYGTIDIRVAGGISGQNCDAPFNVITTNGSVVIIPIGRFHLTRTDNRDNNVSVIGTKTPTYKADLTQLEGGSIIVGTLELKGLNPTVRNIGVDHGITEFPVARDDALVLASQFPFTSISQATVQNVIGLVAEVEDAHHAILIEGHFDCNVDNIVGIYGFFGAALKNTRNNLTNLIFIENGSDSLIVKSDTTSGKVEEVNISNVICKGSGTTGATTTSFAVRLSAFDNDINDINISNVTANNASYVIYLDASAADAGVMKSVNINNIVGSDTGRGVLIDGGSGTGLVDQVIMNNLQFENVEFRSFEVKGNVGKITVDNFFASSIASGTLKTSFFQVLDSVKLDLSNITLVEDNDLADPCTLNLTNAYANNKINGNNNFIIAGTGIPRRGYSANSGTGVTIAVTAVYDSNNFSLVEMNASGTRSITQIVRDLPSGTRFPYGYKLTIVNNASGTLTLVHDASNFIYNRGSANFAVAPNEVVSYIFLNAVWHQL
jgi:hypothetical protein